MDKGTFALAQYTPRQSESSWALWGGVASGLAGPAAGLATAMEIQSKNAVIREQNKINQQAMAPIIGASLSKMGQISSEIKTVEEEIEKIKEKLVSDIPPDKVFDKLKITKSAVKLLETGAYKISAIIQAKDELYIFDDIPAIIDGTIIAHIMQDGVKIGEANLVFPFYGISTKEIHVTGLFIDPSVTQNPTSVTFTPGNLWLMEK